MKWLDLKEGMELTKRRGSRITRARITKISPSKENRRIVFEIEDRFTEDTFKKDLDEYVFGDTEDVSLFSNDKEDKKKLKAELKKQRLCELKEYHRIKGNLKKQFNIVVQTHISLKLKLERF